MGDALHGITVKTVDPYGAEGIKREIEKFLQPPQFAQTWIDMNTQFFEAVRLERTVNLFAATPHLPSSWWRRCGIVNLRSYPPSPCKPTASIQDHESDRCEYLADRVGLFGTGSGRGSFWNINGAGIGHDADSLPKRIQPLAPARLPFRFRSHFPKTPGLQFSKNSAEVCLPGILPAIVALVCCHFAGSLRSFPHIAPPGWTRSRRCDTSEVACHPRPRRRRGPSTGARQLI